MKSDAKRTIKRRSITGVVFNGIAQLSSLIGGFVLSIYLSVDIFGVFSVVTATTVFLGYFSDIGLAAALIQKKDKITSRDLATTFTVQQILVIVLVTIAFLSSDYIASVREFSPAMVGLYKALVIAFFLSSLKTIPSILLERDLRFRELAIPVVLEVIAFNAIVIYYALQGAGIEMFSVAVIARGIIGTIAIYILKPWIPRIGIYRNSARSLIRFGIPFQINSLLALTKDQLFIMILPFFLSSYEIGLISWAKRWAEMPLRLVMDNIIKVTFPTYARLQSYPAQLAKGINKTLYILLLAILPMSIGMIFVIEPLIELIPRYEKWEPALLSFYLFVFSATVAAVSTPLLNALNAIGKIRITLNFMVFWTIFMWTVGLWLISLIGFDGFAVASALMSGAVIAVVSLANRHIAFNLYTQLKGPLVASIGMGLVLYVIQPLFQWNYAALLLYMFCGMIVYSSMHIAFFRKRFLHELDYILTVFRT